MKYRVGGHYRLDATFIDDLEGIYMIRSDDLERTMLEILTEDSPHVEVSILPFTYLYDSVWFSSSRAMFIRCDSFFVSMILLQLCGLTTKTKGCVVGNFLEENGSM